MQIKRTRVKTSLTILTLLLLSIVPSFNVKGHSLISIIPGASDITIATEKMTLKVNNYKPNFSFWHYNESYSIESYNVRFTKIQEYFGSDDYYLDSISELGGISYNLLTSDWDYTITELTQEIIVNLTLSGLANNAAIQIIIHLYSFYSELDYTGTYINRFSEARVEVIIKDWLFTTGARGIAIKAEVYESEKAHEVIITNNTDSSASNILGLDFISDTGPTFEKSYLRWVTINDYYEGDIFKTNNQIDTTYFNDTYSNPADEIVHPWFSYPKVNNSMVMNHDMVLGVYSQELTPSGTMTANLFILPIIGAILFIDVLIIGYRKRARK